MTSQWLENGCSKKFKLLKYEHIIYSFETRKFGKFEHVITFAKYLNFVIFLNTVRNFAKSDFARIFAKFKYLAKQFIVTESPDHLL